MVLVGMQRTSRVAWVLSFASSIAGSQGGQRRTLYQVLGLAPDADGESIKTAYRALARRLHPDVSGGDTAASAERLVEVNSAYETLSNADARAAYDRELARRRAEARRRYAALAAVSVLTFALTAGLVSFALRRHLDAAPEAALASRASGPGDAAQTDAPPGASASDGERAPIWKTYRDARFDFSLRYPAGVFALDAARSDAHTRTFISRDGQALLRIVAAENTSGMTLANLRRSLMKERYAGAAFDPAPRRQHWFALSGTRSGEVFLERITFSCDGRSMHGWQMLYPSSQRSTYDGLAKLVLLNRPHGNDPGCDDERGNAQTKQHGRQKRG
jgi:hypothetical protein